MVRDNIKLTFEMQDGLDKELKIVSSSGVGGHSTGRAAGVGGHSTAVSNSAIGWSGGTLQDKKQRAKSLKNKDKIIGSIVVPL